MIIVKLISGLGNQLFQYAIARQLAIKNNVSLKLDISFYRDQSLRSYRLDKYNISATIADTGDLNNVLGVYTDPTVYGKIYRKVEKHLPKQYKRLYKESEWWAYEPELLKITDRTYLDGYWQHYKYYEYLDKRIFDELTLKDAGELSQHTISKAVQQDESSVSIHIRRGDYITDNEANKLMGILPMEYYQRAIKHIREKVKTPSFYVFSDDLDWAKDNLRIDGAVSFADIDNGSKDYLELDLMSKCRHNIMANSSFSWWGAFLNRNADKVVVSPSQWIRQEAINKKTFLHYPGWVKL
jgi:hypothetical protein